MSHFFLSAPVCNPILISRTSSGLIFGTSSALLVSIAGLWWGWHICVNACFSFQSEESYKGPHTLKSSSVSVDVIGGNAEAGSVCNGKHTVPLQPDLVRETGSSWWQAKLGAPLCPQPRLPASLALQARLLAGPQVIDKQIMETNKACLLSPHGDVAPCCWKHCYSRL